MRGGFSASVCVDLGAFDPTAKDAGAGAWLERADGVPAWVVLMEDRAPDWFHGWKAYDPSARVPLNRHGPHPHQWTESDVKRLVDGFHARGVKVLLGYWVHECRWVDKLHPELLIRDQHGNLWQDEVELNADFNPMRRLHADAEHDVREGERYAHWSARQYAKLARAFGFDGLFLGDGAMGFRRHGKDWKDLRHFDYHEDWLAEFAADHAFSRHEGCALLRADATTQERSDDVKAAHWDHWVAWNCARWAGYYRDVADAVHATGGILAAYNCMNYDPALARLHGVDYRLIAEAGLDVLVFQAYDYAWGPLGPFGFLHIARKDLATNLATLLRTRAHVGFDTPMRIVLTVETEDEVEGWNAPAAHTLGELHAYGNAVAQDGSRWRRALDGAFVVWGNSVPSAEWRALGDAFEQLAAEPPAPRAAVLFDVDEVPALARRVPTAVEPEEIYAHLDLARTVGEGSPRYAITPSKAPPLAGSPKARRAPTRA